MVAQRNRLVRSTGMDKVAPAAAGGDRGAGLVIRRRPGGTGGGLRAKKRRRGGWVNPLPERRTKHGRRHGQAALRPLSTCNVRSVFHTADIIGPIWAMAAGALKIQGSESPWGYPVVTRNLSPPLQLGMISGLPEGTEKKCDIHNFVCVTGAA